MGRRVRSDPDTIHLAPSVPVAIRPDLSVLDTIHLAPSAPAAIHLALSVLDAIRLDRQDLRETVPILRGHRGDTGAVVEVGVWADAGEVARALAHVRG